VCLQEKLNPGRLLLQLRAQTLLFYVAAKTAVLERWKALTELTDKILNLWFKVSV
jgi:hypothetical protein